MKLILTLNTVFILCFFLPILTLSNISPQNTFNELTEIEKISKNNTDKYYCLVLSSNKTDEDFISNTSNNTDLNIFSNLSLTFSYHKEIYHPSVYCLLNGVLQFRKKIGIFNEEFIYFLKGYLQKSTDNTSSSPTQATTLMSQSLISLETREVNNKDHFKKVIIAIILVLLLSILIVLIIKYSIDWALSSRLELNFQKEIKKKDAIETLIENTQLNKQEHPFDSEQNKLELEDN